MHFPLIPLPIETIWMVDSISVAMNVVTNALPRTVAFVSICTFWASTLYFVIIQAAGAFLR